MEVFEIKVSEVISTKYLEDFLLTSIKSKNIILNSKTHIYYSFIEYILSYQVLVFERNDNSLPELFLIDSPDEELFVFDDYFVLYKNNRPFYYKKIEEKLDIDDLKLFVKNYLGIKNIKVTYSKDANWKNQDIKIDYKFIKAVKNLHFLYYILYLCVLLFIFIYFYMNIERKDEKDNFGNLQTNIKRVKKEKVFTYISKEVLSVYSTAKDNDVIVSSMLFENSKFLLILESKKKDGIYKLLTNIENSFLEDMQYNKEEKRYKAHVSFKISRN